MRHALVVISVALMLVPTAASTWRFAGTSEPDTQWDTSEWMFQDPPPPGSSRVYFAALTMLKGPVGASPNVGALQSRMEPPAAEFHVAVLGVWKDCNGDGYIGAAEHALREYPSIMLANTSVCPPSPPSSAGWPAGSHNYNGSVSELIPIGTVSRQDARVYRDDDAKVWGDYHAPTERPFFQSCTLRPFPRTTMQDTGGMMNYVECRIEQKLYMNGLEAFNTVVDSLGDPLGLRFDNIDDARSGPLGQITTFGTEDEGNSPAYVWDCGGTTTTVPGYGKVWRIDPRVGNPNPTQWTIPAFYNHTYEGLDPVEDCNHSNDAGAHFYGNFETDFNPIDPNNKLEADWNMGFSLETRGVRVGTVSYGQGGPPSTDLGVGWTGYQMSGWYADSVWLSKLGPNTVKVTLDEGAGFAPSHKLTFYAYVGQQTLDRAFQLPTNAGGKYGEWHCGANTSGIHNGWNCDAGLWYINPDGTYPPPAELARSAKPGWTYQLRDVDCYDGSIMGLPTGGPALGSDACD